MVVLMTCSLGACSNRNTALKNQIITQNGTNLSMSKRNNIQSYRVIYKDGIYRGEGNKYSGGNHTAAVTISGGKIVNVVLKTIDPQGREINTNKQTNSAAGKNNQGTAKNTNEATTGNKIGEAVAGMLGRIPGEGINVSRFERIRRDLAMAMVQQQTYNVNVAGVEKKETPEINNWKLAVSRALNSARK
jgi:uncharacterized protein with FMN-binding domain